MESQTNMTEKGTLPGNAVPPKVMKEFPKTVGGGGGTSFKVPMVVWVFVVVLTGIGTGWLLSGSMNPKADVTGSNSVNTGNSEKVANETGVLEKDVEYKEVEGNLVEGGIGGEGTHHLERDGGPTQSVYLTSSTLDLQSYVGKKVHVWGITISGQQAGWLMEVGKISIKE